MTRSPRSLHIALLLGALLLLGFVFFLIRQVSPASLSGSLVQEYTQNGHVFHTAVTALGQGMAVPETEHGILHCPTDDAIGTGYRYLSPSELGERASLKVYEFTQDFASEKQGQWVGAHFGYGSGDTLTSFKPGRSYYLRGLLTSTARCTDVEHGYAIDVSEATNGPAFRAENVGNGARTLRNQAMIWSLWLKPHASQDHAIIFQSGNPFEEGEAGYALVISGTTLTFIMTDSSSQIWASADVPHLQTPAWSHIAVRYDGTGDGGSISLYLNGMILTPPNNAGTLTGVSPPAGPRTIDIGISFQGLLDDVRIYDRAHNLDEIENLGNANRFDDTAVQLAYHWGFDDGTLGTRGISRTPLSPLLPVSDALRYFTQETAPPWEAVAAPAAVCGNGVRETNELCDDGNTENGDGCARSCRCGNSVVDEGEDCDDGNDVTGDGCNSVCVNENAFSTGATGTGILVSAPVAICGNGVRETGELCDDGNLTNNDACPNGCRCGNYVKDWEEEECDRGKNPANTTCDAFCRLTDAPITSTGAVACQMGLFSDEYVLNKANGYESSIEIVVPDDDLPFYVATYYPTDDASFSGVIVHMNKCGTPLCDGAITKTEIRFPDADHAGVYTPILTSDGLPFFTIMQDNKNVSQWDESAYKLWIVKCLNTTCTAYEQQLLDQYGFGQLLRNVQTKLMPDGKPLIFATTRYGDWYIYTCNDNSCRTNNRVVRKSPAPYNDGFESIFPLANGSGTALWIVQGYGTGSIVYCATTACDNMITQVLSNSVVGAPALLSTNRLMFYEHRGKHMDADPYASVTHVCSENCTSITSNHFAYSGKWVVPEAYDHLLYPIKWPSSQKNPLFLGIPLRENIPHKVVTCMNPECTSTTSHLMQYDMGNIAKGVALVPTHPDTFMGISSRMHSGGNYDRYLFRCPLP